MSIQIKMSEQDHIILNVWVDKHDKEFSIFVKEGFLCITDNTRLTMAFKRGFWHDYKIAPYRKTLKTIFERAMKGPLQKAGFIFIKLED